MLQEPVSQEGQHALGIGCGPLREVCLQLRNLRHKVTVLFFLGFDARVAEAPHHLFLKMEVLGRVCRDACEQGRVDAGPFVVRHLRVAVVQTLEE